MASNVDAALGGFVEMLKAKDMWENTLLWLTTDNGGMTWGDAALGYPAVAVSVSSNWPLRGGKVKPSRNRQVTVRSRATGRCVAAR